MISLPRLAHLFLAVCVTQVLAFSPPTYSQAAPAASDRGQNAQPASVDAAAKAHQPMWWKQLQAYFDLSSDIYFSETQFQAETREGKNPVPKQDYSKEMLIGKDEEQIMRAILIDAFEQSRENDRLSSEHYQAINEKYAAKHNADHQPWGAQFDAEMAAERQESAKRHWKVYEEAIAKLKQMLGEDSFNKVNAWTIRNFGGGVRGQNRPDENYNVEQAPEMQQ